MKLISAALEAEGYGPSQVSADEVVRHLWWEKESLKKAVGSSTGDGTGQELEKLPQLFQVCAGWVGDGCVCVHMCVCVCVCVHTCVCVSVCVFRL